MPSSLGIRCPLFTDCPEFKLEIKTSSLLRQGFFAYSGFSFHKCCSAKNRSNRLILLCGTMSVSLGEQNLWVHFPDLWCTTSGVILIFDVSRISFCFEEVTGSLGKDLFCTAHEHPMGVECTCSELQQFLCFQNLYLSLYSCALKTRLVCGTGSGVLLLYLSLYSCALENKVG